MSYAAPAPITTSEFGCGGWSTCMVVSWASGSSKPTIISTPTCFSSSLHPPGCRGKGRSLWQSQSHWPGCCGKGLLLQRRPVSQMLLLLGLWSDGHENSHQSSGIHCTQTIEPDFRFRSLFTHSSPSNFGDFRFQTAFLVLFIQMDTE